MVAVDGPCPTNFYIRRINTVDSYIPSLPGDDAPVSATDMRVTMDMMRLRWIIPYKRAPMPKRAPPGQAMSSFPARASNAHEDGP